MKEFLIALAFCVATLIGVDYALANTETMQLISSNGCPGQTMAEQLEVINDVEGVLKYAFHAAPDGAMDEFMSHLPKPDGEYDRVLVFDVGYPHFYLVLVGNGHCLVGWKMFDSDFIASAAAEEV